MDAAVRVGELRQRVEVGALELEQLTMLQHIGGNGVLGREIFEDVLRGGDDLAFAILERLGKVHLVEEDIA